MKRSVGRAIAVTVLLVVSALLPARAAAGPPVRIGSKRFAESYILAEIVTARTRAAGLVATHEQGLGGTAIVARAIEEGAVDAYVEYTGTLAEVVLGARAGGGDLASLRAAAAPRGLAVSDPLGFENTYALAVRDETARARALSAVSDLARHPDLRFGITHELLGRGDGFTGLARTYALRPASVQGFDHALAYEALSRGDIDVTDVYTTDAKIARLGLVVLADDRGYFPPYDAVLVYRRDLLVREPAFGRVLEALAGSIDAGTMRALNARAELDGVPFAAVAAEHVGGAARRVDERRPGLVAGIVRATSRHGPRHVLLVGVAVGASTLVGVPLGVLAFARRRTGAVVLGVAGILQTIPSLALFCFLIPAFGIGATPALVALFLYGLLPVVRNTHAGLAAVPPELRETASALGLSGWEKLRHVELPLARGTMLAGIKTSAVVAVGTATIAAFIGAGGLGEPISTGLALNDVPMILEGAVPAAVLALLVQAIFAAGERLAARRSGPSVNAA